jgi:hypothetical protein
VKEWLAYLIKNHHRTSPQHSSRQPNQLSLSLAEVATAGVDLSVEPPMAVMAVADLEQDRLALRIGVLVEGVEVLA